MAALSVARRHTPSQVGDYGPRNQESGNPLTISRTVDRGGAESEHPLETFVGVLIAKPGERALWLLSRWLAGSALAPSLGCTRPRNRGSVPYGCFRGGSSELP